MGNKLNNFLNENNLTIEYYSENDNYILLDKDDDSILMGRDTRNNLIDSIHKEYLNSTENSTELTREIIASLNAESEYKYEVYNQYYITFENDRYSRGIRTSAYVISNNKLKSTGIGYGEYFMTKEKALRWVKLKIDDSISRGLKY